MTRLLAYRAFDRTRAHWPGAGRETLRVLGQISREGHARRHLRLTDNGRGRTVRRWAWSLTDAGVLEALRARHRLAGITGQPVLFGRQGLA